jgi:hypothetical protein
MSCNSQTKTGRCVYAPKNKCGNCSGGSCGIASHIAFHREGRCKETIGISIPVERNIPTGTNNFQQITASAETNNLIAETTSDIERMFRMRAEKLLNETILEINIAPNIAKRYRISEIEFYYHEKEIHEDEYAHRDELQLEYGYFYPHRINGKGFKGGTFKCMDITYGSRERNVHFGILIRSVRNIETGEFFTGPCICVNEFLKNFGATEWKELGDDVIKFVNTQFSLKEVSIQPLTIFTGPRVGLSDKYPDFKDKEYRYAIDVRDIKKQKIFKQLV